MKRHSTESLAARQNNDTCKARRTLISLIFSIEAGLKLELPIRCSRTPCQHQEVPQSMHNGLHKECAHVKQRQCLQATVTLDTSSDSPHGDAAHQLARKIPEFQTYSR
jgi:hypothetical protein